MNEDYGFSREGLPPCGSYYRVNGELLYVPDKDEGGSSERTELRLLDGSICGDARLYWSPDDTLCIEARWDRTALDRVYEEGGPYLTLETCGD